MNWRRARGVVAASIAVALVGCIHIGWGTSINWHDDTPTVNGTKLPHARVIHVEQPVTWQRLRLATPCGDVTLRGGDGELASLEVTIYEKEPGDVTLQLTAEGLIATSTAGHPTLIHHIHGSVPHKPLTVSSTSGRILLTSFKNSGELEAHGVSSHVTVSDVQSLEQLKIHTVSGDVDVTQAAGVDQCRLKTVSGDIHLSEANQINTLRMNSTSGDAELRDVDVIDSASWQTVSGDATVTRSKAQSMTIHTVSGDITMRESEIAELIAETISGDVDLQTCDVDRTQFETVSGKFTHNDK